jgi:type II secretion system-associated lipoprotein
LLRLKLMLFFLLPLCACTSFITKPEETLLKEKEKNVYILKKDIDLETKKLKKGDAVRILIATGREWLKVYAYPVRVEKLKAERFLLVYLFEDEFVNKQFNIDLFNEKLDALVALKDEKATPPKKAIKIRNK